MKSSVNNDQEGQEKFSGEGNYCVICRKYIAKGHIKKLIVITSKSQCR